MNAHSNPFVNPYSTHGHDLWLTINKNTGSQSISYINELGLFVNVMSKRYLAATKLTKEEMDFLKKIVEKTNAETISDALRFCIKVTKAIQDGRVLLAFPYDFLGDLGRVMRRR